MKSEAVAVVAAAEHAAAPGAEITAEAAEAWALAQGVLKERVANRDALARSAAALSLLSVAVITGS